MTGRWPRAALPLPLLRRGKVREVYEVDAEHLLLVASDRVSAFDVVMREPIPHKGAVLTQISAFWFERLGGVVPSHYRHRATPTRSCARSRARGAPRARSRAARCWCAARRRCRSSAWCAATSPARRGPSIARSGTLAGEPLPAGLVESARLEPPLFSPATKAETGHDVNVTVRRRGRRRSGARARRRGCATRASRVYRAGRDHAAPRGIIIADTKFEFGIDADGALRADRRGADARLVALLAGRPLPPGRSQPSFDKQPLRDYLARTASGRAAGTAKRRRRRFPPRWSRPPAARYLEAFRLHHRPRAGAPLMRTAPEGRWFIVGAWASRSLLVVLAARPASPAGGSPRAWLALAIWVVAFFRDPERAGPAGEQTGHRAGGRQGGERDRDGRADVPRRAGDSGSRSS